ncbi:hypothetical protein [Bacillus aquiflavi]|uniref:hypothetical protein n=1 Tax=Bacillus aquiflavi TaxID=2672567 RepID=UPI00223C3C63|nr:hypothetical protein [Bacillus aquiflavi]
MINERKKTIYILLTDTGTLFTKTIKKYTEAPYNHVSISFDIGLNDMYSFGRKHPRNPLYAGFVKEDEYRGTYRYFPKTKCILFKLEVTARQLVKIKRIIRSFQDNQVFYKYNLVGLFGVVVNFPIELKNAFFCSQFVAEVLKRSGIKLWDKSSALVTPNDFLEHSAFTVLYEGKLYEYPLLLTTELLYYKPRSFRRTFIYDPYKKIKKFFIPKVI